MSNDVIKAAYRTQKCNAKKRGIDFLLTFDEWWSLWKDYFHMRGRGANGLCMARHNDCGAYSIENVYITTNLGNLKDYHGSEKAKKVRCKVKVTLYEKRIKTIAPWGKRDFGGVDKVFKEKLKVDWEDNKKIALQDEINER